jgi:formylglycine-generating enzyme required for sulfatase activity
VGGLLIGIAIALAMNAPRSDEAPAAAAPSATSSALQDARASFVAGGRFEVGCATSEALCPSGALPPTAVELAPFVVDRHEVTVADYRVCVNDGACNVDGLTFDVLGCNWNEAGRAEHPINCVSWAQADAYCRWRGSGLPTEAQWEKAARGSERRDHPWGSDPPSCALAVMHGEDGVGCGRDGTWRVGSRPQAQSPNGAQDMAGNVREWVADWYIERPDAAALAAGPSHGPDTGSERVVRGGGFRDEGDALRSTDRMHLAPETRAVDLGFRCVRGEH